MDSFRSPLALAALLVVQGCWLSGAEVQSKLDGDVVDDTSTDDTGDTDTDTDPLPVIEVVSVEPAFGTAAGGTEVTLEVEGLGGAGANVQVGGKSAEIVSASGDEIVVRTPAGSAGPASVTVTSGERADTAEGAFTYYADATGHHTLLGSVSWTHYNGTYWSTTPVDTGLAWIRPVKPTTVDYGALLFGASMDVCKNHYAGGSVVDIDLGADAIALQAPGGRVLDLAWSAEGDRYESDLAESDFLAGNSYDLMPVETDLWPEFTVEDGVRTPTTFAILAPAVGGSSPPQIVATNFVINWTSSSTPGDYMVLQLERYDASFSGPVVTDVVTCVLTDDGEFKVPIDVWTGWAAFITHEQITMRLGRVQESTATLPHDNSTVGVVGVYWNVGAGLQYY